MGTGLGGMVHVTAGAVGVSALVLASATLFSALKLVGAAYLVGLGMRTILSARRHGSLPVAPPSGGVLRAFRDGVLVEALNPKTAAFFLAFLPQFVDPRAGHIAAQFAGLGLVSVLLNTLADLAVCLAAGAVQAGARANPRLIGRLRAGSGAAMIGLGCGLLLAERPAR